MDVIRGTKVILSYYRKGKWIHKVSYFTDIEAALQFFNDQPLTDDKYRKHLFPVYLLKTDRGVFPLPDSVVVR